MAKRQTLLFELMKDDEKSESPKSIWDYLFRKKEASLDKSDKKSADDEVSTSVEEVIPSSSPSPASRPETEPEEEPDQSGLGKTRLYLRLNLYSLVLAGTAMLVVFFCAYLLGKSVGYHEGTRQRSDLQLTEVQNKPVENEVLDIFPEKPEKKVSPQPAAVPAAQETSAPPQPIDISKNGSKITRKIGLNYLIIQIFEMDAIPIAQIAQKYLADQGVETTIERTGRTYKLISAAGFESGDPQKDSFKTQIETIGQQFKQLREAYGVSFKGCYYEKWK